MISVTMTQHPVGQGGMVSGLLEIPGGRFHWVYDCGSNQAEPLRREIAAVGARGDIDCLFLSHLDSDHLNGIDRLLMTTRVQEVVLPYLNYLDRLVAAAHDHATGAFTGNFLTFLGDIEGWFGSRGVERITYIMPRDDGGDDEAGVPEFPLGRDGEGPISPKWWPGSEAAQSPSGGNKTRKRGPIVRRIDTTQALVLSSAGGMVDWLLLPFAHRPSDEKLLAFRRAMYRKFGPRYQSRLVALLSDPIQRESVRGCYDLIWSDHNLVSMALYAGPHNSSAWTAECLHSPGWWRRHPGSQAVGWLGTGDMHLNGVQRRKAMICHYRGVLDQVNVFGLPHHGSHRNYHPSLPDLMPNMTQCVAAAGPNGYGHPSDSVKQSVLSAGREFVHVNDRGHKTLQWKLLR